jgi:farnesyl diphosphate synthase
MAGGQAIDLASVGLALDSGQLHDMHRLKTGALLQASVLMGAACGAADAAATSALADYGSTIGLAFQVVDDILDVTADSQTLGKTAGKDAAHEKPTFVSLMGLSESRRYAQSLLAQAQASLRQSGLPNTTALGALADRLVHRAF